MTAEVLERVSGSARTVSGGMAQNGRAVLHAVAQTDQAMVLIAATVSLRFARFGGIGWMILGGIGAGFVLYVVTKVAKDLGNAGLVDPSAAAWSPAVIGMLIGFSVLLNQEDG